MTIDELIAALEAADGPSQELDCQIELLFGFGQFGEWENMGDFWRRHKKTGEQLKFLPGQTLRYTSSLDACAALQEKVLPGWDTNLCANEDCKHAALSDPCRCYTAEHKSWCIAWLIAILRAVKAQREDLNA